MNRAGRAGNMSERQGYTSTKKGPDPNSETSKRRKNRGFKSLEVSSRKHRRAAKRSVQTLTQYGKYMEPGQKSEGAGHTHTAGGSIRYH